MADQTLRFQMDRLLSYDDGSLLDELRRVGLLLPDGPITRTAFDAESRVHSTTLLRRFGGWQQALERAGLGCRYGGQPVSAKMRDQRARIASADDMIEELQRVAAIVGRSVITRAEFLQHAEIIGERAIINRFGSWKAALESAGLELSAMGRRWSDEDYFENLLDVWTHRGRAPSYAQMNEPPSRITNGAYAAKFGSWGKAKLAFVERVNNDIELVQRETTLPRVPSLTQPKPRQEDQRHIPIGLRYQVLRRDRFRCVTCGRSPASDLHCVLHVDHTVPFSRGGKTTLENLRSLCAECNVGKGAKDR
ncbi:MAG: HNH endonuclease [Intrasporangium sp.]|uniref:homing endonuclease associated repeat-containing protein n=1 Tax=Intrasporangium sp. TaxID=1925024 RepID=UPI002649A099|nr:HNH endonuclease [Intrasporangium sp.]MDN5797208.1 HNH endonuclease [Intrasporangium sp.]